jgi:tetratricopeptide (TPR) repeat protein
MSTILPHTSLFVGQDAMLDSLHATLAHERTIVINGPDGIGKTAIARRYRNRFSSQYPHVLWMTARTRELLLADGVDLSRQLGLPLWKQYALPLMLQPLRDWLATHDDYLLIFDGAAHPAMIKEIFPTHLAGRTIITARARGETEGVANLDVPPLGERDGAYLILCHAAIIPQTAEPEHAGEQTYRAAEELAHALHGLPLAFELAGAYIKMAHCGVREYLDLYRSFMADAQSTEARTDTPVIKACMLTNAYLERNHPQAAAALRISAYLAPGAISAQLFAPATPRREGDDTTPLAVLEALHLVTVQRDDSTLEMPPCVQAGVRNTLTPKDQQLYLEGAMSAIHRHLPPEDDVFAGANLRYLAQIKRLADAGERWTFTSPEAAEVFAWAAMITANREDHHEAADYLSRALAIWKTALGETHPVVIESAHRLASLYMQAEAYDQTEAQWHQVIRARSQVPDTDRAVLIRCLKELGVAYTAQGKLENAEITYGQALAFCEQAVGKEHPLALEIQYQMALLYQVTERYAEAASLFAFIHAQYEKISGPSHDETLGALHALATVYMLLGREKEADSLLRKLLHTYERTQGKRSPAMVACLFQLWQLETLRGKTDHTNKLSHQIIAIFEDLISAPDDPEILAHICGLAGMYMEMQRFDEAERLWERALAICERMPELGFAAINVTLQGLAAVYVQQGRKRLAIVTLKYALTLLDERHVPEEEKTSLREEYQQRIIALQ